MDINTTNHIIDIMDEKRLHVDDEVFPKFSSFITAYYALMEGDKKKRDISIREYVSSISDVEYAGGMLVIQYKSSIIDNAVTMVAFRDIFPNELLTYINYSTFRYLPRYDEIELVTCNTYVSRSPFIPGETSDWCDVEDGLTILHHARHGKIYSIEDAV